MFNNLRKLLQGEVSHNKQSLNSCFYLLSLAVVLATSAINIARADVCFLPDGKGCEQVPYEEYGGVQNQTYPKDCYATKAEAMSARTDSMDSYYKDGDMWCIKPSCLGYDVASMKPGSWDCQNCNDANSLNYNKYKCSCNLEGATPRSGYTIDLERCEEKPNACPSYASTNCVPDECHECNSVSSVNPVYSGGKECLIYNTVDAHCPEGYVPDKPSSKCYSTQDMLCGEGKCYNADTTIPDCSGEGKQLSDDNGACWCSCKTGYHDDNNGGCVLNQCTTGVAENKCDPATHTFTSNNTSFTNTSGNTIICGTCEENNVGNDDCSTWVLWIFNEWSSTYHYVVSGAENVTAQYKDEYSLADDEDWRDYMYKSCLNDTVTFSIEPTDCMQIDYGWYINGTYEVSGDTSFTFTMTQDFIDQYDIVTNESYNYAGFDFTSFGTLKSTCETKYGNGECVENTSRSGCYEVCHTKSYCENHLRRGEECFVSHTSNGRDCWEAKASNQATIYCDYYEQRYDDAQNSCDSNVFSNSTIAFNPCGVSYTVKANGTPICEGASNASGSYGLTSTTITAGTYNLTVDYSGYLGYSHYINSGSTKCYRKYAPDILVVYDENPTSSFRCWQIGQREYGYHSTCSANAGPGCHVSSVEMRSEMSSNNYNTTNAEAYIFDNFIAPSGGVTANCPTTSSDYNLPSYTFEGGKTYYIRAGSVSGSSYGGSIHKCWYEDY